MPDNVRLYNFGQFGVDLVSSPIHLPDGAFTLLQNAEFSSDQAMGGVAKRGSLLAIATDTLAGPVMAMIMVPIPATIVPVATSILFGYGSGAPTKGWITTSDGIAFTDILIATLIQGTVGGGTDTDALYAATVIASAMVFLAAPLAPGISHRLLKWDGSAQTILRTTLDSPPDTNVLWVRALGSALYLAIFVNIPASSEVGTFFQGVDRTTGALTSVSSFGPTFTNGANVRLLAIAATTDDVLWGFTDQQAGVPGGVAEMWFTPASAPANVWTQDPLGAITTGFAAATVWGWDVVGLGLDLFAVFLGIDAGTGVQTFNLKRRTLGAWVASLDGFGVVTETLPTSPFVTFDGTVYIAITDPTGDIGGTPNTTVIMRWNTSTLVWELDTTVEDVLGPAATGPWVPLQGSVFSGTLYWAVQDNWDDSTATGQVMSRTTGAAGVGVWAVAVANKALTGAVAAL